MSTDRYVGAVDVSDWCARQAVLNSTCLCRAGSQGSGRNTGMMQIDKAYFCSAYKFKRVTKRCGLDMCVIQSVPFRSTTQVTKLQERMTTGTGPSKYLTKCYAAKIVFLLISLFILGTNSRSYWSRSTIFISPSAPYTMSSTNFSTF